MDLRPTIQRLGRDYTVTRRGAVTRVDGRASVADGSTLTIRAVITPGSAGDVQRLPEGARIDNSIRVLSTTELQTVDVAAQRVADRISYGGSTWEVLVSDGWGVQGMFCDAVAIQVSE